MAKKNDIDPLELALETITKELGDGIVRDGLEGSGIMKVDVIPTGALALDVALGVGGIPRGRITELYGPEGGGKSTLALHLVANVQKAGGKAVYVDVEHAVDIKYAKDLGVNVKSKGGLLFSQPDSAEQAFKILELMAATGKIDVMILDSIAALATQKELDGELEDHMIAEVARMLTKAFKRLNPIIKNNNVALICINQLRHKIGVTFGSSETTPGGRALKYYASLRMDIRRISGVKENSSDKDFNGNVVRIKTAKNRVAPPFRTAEFEIIFGKGINSVGSILDMAVQNGVVERRGSSYNYDGTSIGSGRNNVIKILEGDDELLGVIEAAVKKIVMPHLFSEDSQEEEQDGKQ